MVASRAGKRFRRSLVGVAAIGSHPQKPALVSIAKGRIPIAVDGGIRRGSDIFKALALGAKFCFIGRIPFWGLAYNGQDGVELAIRILRQELRITMALAGCRSISEIQKGSLSILQPDRILEKF